MLIYLYICIRLAGRLDKEKCDIKHLVEGQVKDPLFVPSCAYHARTISGLVKRRQMPN